jgi:hypothetical protein
MRESPIYGMTLSLRGTGNPLHAGLWGYGVTSGTTNPYAIRPLAPGPMQAFDPFAFRVIRQMCLHHRILHNRLRR